MVQKQIWASYFSPTGTTKKICAHIAKELAGALGGEVKTFDFTLPAARENSKAFSEGDLVVLGLPVYAGRIPNLMLKYVNSLEGNGAWAVPVVLFGNRAYDNALIELRNILEEHGFHTVAGAAFVGEHSFSKILGANRPDAADLAVASEFAARVAQKLSAEGPGAGPVPVKGEEPIPPYYQPRDGQGNSISIIKVRPKTSEACVKCGLCAKICPMGAIDPDDVSRVPGTCIKCGACSKRCPKGAKYYDDPNYLFHKTDLEQKYTRRAEPELFL